MKGIDDLLKESKNNSKKAGPTSGNGTTPPPLAKSAQVSVSAGDVEEKFQEKMEEIHLKELEAATENSAKAQGVPYINLVGFPIASDAITLVSLEVCEEFKFIVFYLSESQMRVGVINPSNSKIKKIVDDVAKEKFVKEVEYYLISENSLETALKYYRKIPKAREIIEGVAISGDLLAKLQKELKNFGIINSKLNEERNMTKMVNMIIAGAMESGSSDIHIEAEEKVVNIRFRVDGVMHQVAKLPKKIWDKLSIRFKTIARLKINITNVPQDGRITVFLEDGEKMDIRVSVLPTGYGESIVMRLLRSNVTSLNFDSLGIRGKAYDDLKREVERPNGMIVTTGPTGSGKTTTLYSILNKLNDGQAKIITLENPIEYKLAGVQQSQIDHSKNYNFADGLRSILRQDPDIVMVGEIRDLETAEVSIQAALTGHLVVSTIHTNDAAGAIPRFISMKVKPFLLAPALNAVIGQRLVRKICPDCKIESKIDKETIERVKKLLMEMPQDTKEFKNIDFKNFEKLKFYRGQGCDKCNHIGLKGRTGIYEIFAMNPDVEKLILAGSTSEFEVAEVAKKHGMIKMVQDGLLKAMDGITTVEEVFRVAE